MEGPLLELRDVHLDFRTPLGLAHALRGITLDVPRASVLGIVGESGAGKTMTGRVILRLLPSNASARGQVLFDGTDLLRMGSRDMRRVRGKRIAMIFQDPYAALNPVFTVGQQLLSVLDHHGVASGPVARAKCLALLSEVGLPDPRRIFDQYPHELSGGMQQRAMIAMALSASPELLIADEPTTALDVTIQAQILDLLLSLRESRGLTVILITHNMRVVQTACHWVAVMYGGRVMEEGPVNEVIGAPKHPYTEALLSSLPTSAGRRKPLAVIQGSIPNSHQEIPGCVFASRCPHVMPLCVENPPPGFRVGGARKAFCWLNEPSRIASIR